MYPRITVLEGSTNYGTRTKEKCHPVLFPRSCWTPLESCGWVLLKLLILKIQKISSLIVYGWLTILYIKYFVNPSAEHALNHQGCSSVPWSIFLGHLGNSVWLVTPLQGCSLSCSWSKQNDEFSKREMDEEQSCEWSFNYSLHSNI